MSGVRPFFITGANAKIRLNGKTLAFCTDLSYSVEILHQTPKVLGMYEGSSVEPLGYTVTGSFTVIRYAKDISAAVKGKKPQGIAENDAGNGVGNWGSAWGGLGSSLLDAAGVGNGGKANEALNPSKFAGGTTFDIQIYQKIDTRGGGSVASAGKIDNILGGVSTILQGGTNSNGGGGSGPNIDFVGVANIRSCRITRADFNISKKSPAIQRFTFTALYVDEDSFAADFSGSGQQFTE